ncbi:ATP-dependent RNA helicase dhx37 [Phlyctochytrium planicorne]|nr:ATP-dependent RNA helicase dhx37 [Phlyctochytrium planicorne]
MGRRRERFNAKARASSKGGAVKKHKASTGASKASRDDVDRDLDDYGHEDLDLEVSASNDHDPEYQKNAGDIPLVLEPGVVESVPVVEAPPAMSSKKRKRLEKFIEKQLKKEDRVKILEKLSKDTFSSTLLQSSASFSKKMSKKEKLRRALLQERAGVPITDGSVRLYVSKDKEEVDFDENNEEGEEEEEEEEGQQEKDEDEEMQDDSKDVATFAQKERTKDTRASEFNIYDDYNINDVGSEDDEDEEGDIEQSPKSAAAAPVFGKGFTSGFGSGLESTTPTAAATNTVTTSNLVFGAALKNGSSGSIAPSIKKGMAKKRRKLGAEKSVPVVAAKKKPGIFDSDYSESADSQDEDQDDSDGGDTGGRSDKEPEENSSEGDEGKLSKNVSRTTMTSAWDKEGKVIENLNLVTTTPKPKAPKQASSFSAKKSSSYSKPAFYVPVHRKEEFSLKRVELPVVGEEQQIMEAILENDCVIICGETGSGKTTQVPQFLYEAGFGDPKHEKFRGIVGITQPRRVAAVSMAKRVAEEMGLHRGEVAYQIRYDSSTVNSLTRIKYMTDGILLRELSGAAGVQSTSNSSSESKPKDLLLLKYSCIIIDEAHERTIGTDILIGWLSRIARLRNGGQIDGGPLKIVIMSATLRVEDFVGSNALFTEEKPPVIKVDGRQYKVTIHYNRITPEIDYLGEAFKKISKIHTKLPPGGILVFMTGKAEINHLVTRLRAAFNPKAKAKEIGGPSSATDGGFFGEAEDFEFEPEIPVDETALDDYDMLEDEDDEEDEVHVLAGEEREDEEVQVDPKAIEGLRLHVLPLHSALPTAAQLRVFQEPPEGTRLCIIATNVAETSITIPGIKYVVDCGKVKERYYDARTGIQNFQVKWTSQASADQRAGRAGRVGPGHCYRLFSSAVFSNYFDVFTKPEILRVPIEGVILQMKAMGISNVINFPFPTPPSVESLRKGEQLLTHLGALTQARTGEQSKITELGTILTCYPISPRYAKILTIAAKQSKRILEFMIAIVAGLTIGEIFIRDDDFKEESSDDEEDDERRRQKRNNWSRVMNIFRGDVPESDVFSVLRAVGAYSTALAKEPKKIEEFCAKHYLRTKAMEEAHRLRLQLIEITQTQDLSNFKLDFNILSPPNQEELAKIRQIMLAGFPDHVAKLEGTVAAKLGAKKAIPIYSTLWSEKGKVFRIHSSSCLARQQKHSQWLVYEEIVKKQEMFNADNTKIPLPTEAKAKEDGKEAPAENLFLKNVTIISDKWIGNMGSESLLMYTKILEQPEPRFVPSKDQMIAFCNPTYGPKLWELPTCEIPFGGVESYMWFAKELLEGKVPLVTEKKKSASKNFFKELMPFLKSKPAIITKPWAKTQSKVIQIVAAFSGSSVCSRETLLAKWLQTPSFMLEPLLPWLPESLQIPIQTFWPPVVFKKGADGTPIPQLKDLEKSVLYSLLNSRHIYVERHGSDVDSD